MSFTPLNVISGYSFLSSGLTIESLTKNLVKNKYSACGLSDLNVLFGVPEFVNSLTKNNIHPVVGLKTTLIIDNQKMEINLYIKNEIGYRNLIKISSLLSINQHADMELIKNYHEGLILVLPSHQDFFKPIVSDNNLTNIRHLANVTSLFEDNFLGIEIYSNNDMEYAIKVREFAFSHSYKVVAFPNIKYINPSDAITLTICNAIENNEMLSIEEEKGPYFLRTKEEINKIYSYDEIENSSLIASLCHFELNTKRGHLLKYPSSIDSPLLLKDQTYLALTSLFGDNELYKTRLDYELEVINNMGYSDYFLIVADYVNYAKNHDIPVGPGRGSAASSLVAYLLNITSVDPLKYNLLFESFLNPARTSMPDIDIDFGDIKRDEVVTYLKQKYGNNKVANIITFSTIGAKQSIRDIGRIYSIPSHHIDMLAKSISDNKLSLREAYKKIPAFRNLVDSDKYYLNIIKLASKIEGLPRQSSLHAAGIVLNNESLIDAIPVIIDHAGNYISQYEMNPLADQGFLKMDLLGLRNLTILDNCLKLVNNRHSLSLTLENIPFDNPKIFSLISDAKSMGLFQLESTGIKRAIKLLKPSSFDDVVALLALFRPGPMNNIPLYAKRKHGEESVVYFDNSLKEILSPTYGIIVYQEQVLEVVKKVASFSLAKADIFRRAISKKDASKLEIMKQEFLDGAIKNNYSLSLANTIYNHILRFADYGFKKAHSVAYSMLSCKMGYLKAYYPLEFYAAILETSSSSSDSKYNEYISEMKSLGLKLILPNINESTLSYEIKEDGLLFPLNSIKGINNLIASDILSERKNGRFTNFFDFVIRMNKYKINQIIIDKLIDSGALDCFGLSRASLKYACLGVLEYASIIGSTYIAGEDNDHFILPPPRIEEIKDNPLECLIKESEALGIMLSKTPLYYKKEELMKFNILSISEAKILTRNITFAGIVKTFKTIKTKKGSPMAFLTLFDDDSELEITVFPDLYATKFMNIKKNVIFVVKGYFDKSNSFIAEDLSLWEE